MWFLFFLDRYWYRKDYRYKSVDTQIARDTVGNRTIARCVQDNVPASALQQQTILIGSKSYLIILLIKNLNWILNNA